MSQATITADIGIKPASATATAARRGTWAKVLASFVAGAVLALAVNSGLGAYQASAAVAQSQAANAAQVQFLRSEHADAPLTQAQLERSVVQHLQDERTESTGGSISLDSVPAFLRTERAEDPAGAY